MTQYDNKNITASIGQWSLGQFMKKQGRQDDWDRVVNPLLFVSICPITDEDILMIGSQSAANCS